MRIFFIHGVSTRRELGHLYAGFEERDDSPDGMRRKYDEDLEDLKSLLAKAAARAEVKEARVVPIYWGDHGARFHWYRRADPGGKLLPLVQKGLGFFRLLRSSEAAAQGGARVCADPEQEEILANLELLVSQRAHESLTLRDLLVLEPLTTLRIMLAPSATGRRAPETEIERRDARIARLANMISDDAAMRRALTAIDYSKPDADVELVHLLAEEFERTETKQAQGGRTEWLFGPIMGLVSLPIIVGAKSSDAYLQGGRFFGDSVRYFSRRGSRATQGDAIRTVRKQLQDDDRMHGPDGPTVFLTHSLGSALFYDLFTYFDESLSFDLWISVGSQLGYYEDAKLLANSDLHGGAYYDGPVPNVPPKVRVRLPAGARWFNVYDPRDPIGFAAAPVFEGVTDKPCFTRDSNVLTIHNSYLHDPVFLSLFTRILGERFPVPSSVGGSRQASR
jgi:hypothetical protein